MPSIDSSFLSTLSGSSTATLAASTTALTTADLIVAQTDDTPPGALGDPIIAVKAMDPASKSEQLEKFKRSWELRGKIGTDASDIARTLKMSMKEVVKKRPDLADKSFDFKLENGRIKVVDTRLEGADLDWLQNELNRNFLLVDKVKSFRSDAIALARNDAPWDGPVPDASALGQQLDDQLQFMRLFRTVGSEIQDTLMPPGTYQTQTGDTFDLSPKMNNAAGFIPFAEQMNAISEGLNYITESGRNTGIGLKMPNAYFNIGFQLHNYLPDFAAATTGFSEHA